MAVDMAEVYILGCALWILFARIDLGNHVDASRVHMDMMRWMIETSDPFGVPRSWRRVIRECVQKNPNKRMSMRPLVVFWEVGVSRFVA